MHGRWLSFTRSEQLAQTGSMYDFQQARMPQTMRASLSSDQYVVPDDKIELARAQDRFASAAHSGSSGAGQNMGAEGVRHIDLLQFSLLILNDQNDASAPNPDRSVDDVERPLSHHWTATSHNSYIVGDQLTGYSDANMYRRLLLQGCRHQEIDCWDGVEQSHPIVTHGHTFCTVETFDLVSQAISECAFVASDLPVILSLEMHCTPPQQNSLAKMLVKHLGDMLLKYEELVGIEGADSLQLVNVKRRVLPKGKVRMAGKVRSSTPQSPRQRLSVLNPLAAAAARATRMSRLNESRRSSMPHESDSVRIEEESSFRREDTVPDAAGSAHSTTADEVAKAYRKRASSKQAAQAPTDEFYSSCVCLRSVPLPIFLRKPNSDSHKLLPSVVPGKGVVTISSINEDRLLAKLGVPRVERYQIEGIIRKMVHDGQALTAAATSNVRLTEEQLSSRAVARLAENPPPEIGQMQRRTTYRLLRLFPLGLRLSGKNMSPLPGWLGGAQHIALNFSNPDLAVQLHFALFSNSQGYVLKPDTMVSAAAADAHSLAADDYWPPPQKCLHRVTVDVLSLHMCPKRGEQRPRHDGSHSACHEYVPSLSGSSVLPDALDPTTPSLTLSLHAVGGFCAISRTLPVPQQHVNTDIILTPIADEMSSVTAFGQKLHLVAAEPESTFVRLAVSDARQDVAFAVAMLGRLCRGYRIFQLRSPLGTRIELCYLLVRVTVGSELNLWLSPRQMRMRSAAEEVRLSQIDEVIKQEVRPHVERNERLNDEVLQLRGENDKLKHELSRQLRHTIAIVAGPVDRPNADEGPDEGVAVRAETAGHTDQSGDPDASLDSLDSSAAHRSRPMSVENPPSSGFEHIPG